MFAKNEKNRCLANASPQFSAGSRHLLQEDEQSGAEAFWDDAKNGVTGAWAKFWGGSCATNDQCADVVATCSASHSKIYLK